MTTPIYYVNAEPHIGHTYTTVAADILARWHRQQGDETFFLTGTDEHGAKIAEKAAEAGVEPQDFVDKVSTTFQKAWSDFGISNDSFIRTTDSSHKQAVQRAVEVMLEKGVIVKDKYEGLYCQGCEQFKNEKDLINGKCPDHLTVPQWMSEEAYMFKLSNFQHELVRRIESDEIKVRPVERKNEILSFITQHGLRDVAFSREKVKWGIPFPGDENHTIYVWADAFLNYLTGLGWQGEAGVCPRMWPATVQLMSKDILRVHATIWQAMLIALDLPTSKELFIHGFFLVEGQKMSKSLDNVIAPAELIKRYGVDGARYLLMSATSFGHDGDIGRKFFDDKFTADLANGLGNLVARVSNLLEKNSIATKLRAGTDQDLTSKVSSAMNDLKFDEVLKILWQKIALMDELLSEKKPWKMESVTEISDVLVPVAQTILNVADLLLAFMPTTAQQVIKQFEANQIVKGESLFPRLVD